MDDAADDAAAFAHGLEGERHQRAHWGEDNRCVPDPVKAARERLRLRIPRRVNAYTAGPPISASSDMV